MIKQFPITVFGFQTDLYGHVNNARYLEFMEAARWDFLEGVIDLREWQKQHIQFVLVNININYRSMANLYDRMFVETSVVKIGDASCTMLQKVMKDGTVVTDAEVTFVMMDAHSKKSIALPETLRQVLTSLLNNT